MTDQTPFFNQCLEIYNESNLSQSSLKKKQHVSLFVEDSFNRESKELYEEIIGFIALVNSIKTSYLLSSVGREFEEEEEEEEEDLNLEPTTKFTDQERDIFDSQSNLLLHKFNKKLKHLATYEGKRSENLWFNKKIGEPNKNKLNLVKSYINFTLNLDEYKKANNTVHEHREGVLSSLGEKLKQASLILGDMQSVRLSRKLEETSHELKLNDNNPSITTAVPTLDYNEQLQIDQDDENLKQYQDTISSLSQTQLKKLETENSELLASKLNELQKVKNLQKSASDIASLQRELSIHVETQMDQIKLLEEDQESAELNVTKGNKELKSAKVKSRRSSLIIIYASVILGFIVVFFDAVIL